MEDPETRSKSARSANAWQKTQFANLIRYVPSGKYYARLRVNGKLIVRSLKTSVISVAKLRLTDLEKHERKVAEQGRPSADGKILFADALFAYCDGGFRPVVARNRKDARKLKPASIAYYEQRVDALLQSWPGQPEVEKTKWKDYQSDRPQGTRTEFKRHLWSKYNLAKMEIRRITEDDCRARAEQARRQMSPTVFNHTLGVLRNVIDFGMKAGARYDNPAKAVMRESEMEKPLELPDSETFQAFVNAVENGGGLSRACGNLVRFMADCSYWKPDQKESSVTSHRTWNICCRVLKRQTIFRRARLSGCLPKYIRAIASKLSREAYIETG